ncbi:MAG TPA: ferric iron uptake transcriptional regulator [Gammaproteobacteria bacterium]|nr:ferric iron uptake transcriptional regulator [Gammaproteobacteria bacterium]
MESHDLKKVGLKATLPRLRILQLLENSKQRHLSAEEVYKKLLDVEEDVGLATVYRVLTQFEAADLVIRHHFENGLSVFELNEGYHHDHLLCVKCGNIVEFFDNVIEDRQRIIAEKHDFKITEHCLYLYGICSKCQKKAEENSLITDNE